MTVRDRALIGALSIGLVVSSIAALAPSVARPGEIGAGASQAQAARPYVEGVLGHATNASPFGARSPADRDLVALLFRGLVRLGPGTAIVPDLAANWESDAAGANWTFHLRQGLSWQDGVPLTAADVAFTIGVLTDPSYSGPGGASWRGVTATAPDPLTVAFHLDTPLGGFLQAVTQPIAPAHLLAEEPVEELSSDAFAVAPVGSGPFRLTELGLARARLDAVSPGDVGVAGPGTDVGSPNGALALVSPTPGQPPTNPKPYLSGIEFRYYDGIQALKDDWKRGTLDAASGLSPADATALADQPGARLVRYRGSTLLAVQLNLRPSRHEFADPRVRRALLAAIDRDALVSGPLGGLGVRADSPIPPSSSLFDPQASAFVAYDPAAARAGLTAAGWRHSAGEWFPKGATTPLSIELLSPQQVANPVAFALARTIAADWRAIGLGVTQIALPGAQLQDERLRTGSFQAAMLPLVIGLDPDLYPLLASSQSRTGGSNVAGLQDPTLDKLLAAARAPATDAARTAAYAALQVRLAQGVYLLPIAFRDEYVVLRDTVQGPVPRAIGTSGDRFWDVLTWRLADGR